VQKITDSQSVKTTGSTEVGHDGGKLIKGHKYHILVDTLGLLLQVLVSADVSEGRAKLLLEKIETISALTEDFRGWGYDGKDFIAQSKRIISWIGKSSNASRRKVLRSCLGDG